MGRWSRVGREPYESWVRFAFGPPLDDLTLGLDRLRDLVQGR